MIDLNADPPCPMCGNAHDATDLEADLAQVREVLGEVLGCFPVVVATNGVVLVGCTVTSSTLAAWRRALEPR